MGEKKRIVVKIGSQSLAEKDGRINLRRIDVLAKVLSGICNEGNEVVLVTSGAIGIGNSVLGVSRGEGLDTLQAAAAVGQIRLMHIYNKMFSEYGTTVAQILLTRGVTDNEVSRKNCLNAFNKLLSMNVIPIVNANDVVTTDEIESADGGFGDNDNLSAIVAELIGADKLIFLTDADGLFDSNPHENPDAKLVPYVTEVTEEIYANCAGKSKLGTGGMTAKVRAAEKMLAAGTDTVIMNSANPEKLYDLMNGESVGTLFSAK